MPYFLQVNRRMNQSFSSSLFVLVCLYVLFYGTLIQIEAETVVVSPITLDVFDQLYAERSETLTCPCSTVTIPYKKFLLNIVKMHPVCSSIFVSKEWIDGLYLENTGLYSVWDFRKSAYGQVSSFTMYFF